MFDIGILVVGGINAALTFAILLIWILKDRTVKGTHIMYLMKTTLIILISLYLVFELLYSCILIYSEEDALQKGWQILLCTTICTLYGRALHRLLNDDDDDWFNDEWKKLKRWSKNFRASLRFKPSFVH
jgi:hypothetical protein